MESRRGRILPHSALPTCPGPQPAGAFFHRPMLQRPCELVHTSLAQLRVTLMVGNEPNSTGNEMKALMAAIALLCVSSTVLAHDIYSTLRDRDGHLCCGGQDCRPVCMSSEHFGQLAWQFKRMSGSSGLKVQAAIAC